MSLESKMGETDSFGSGGMPLRSPKDIENKDGMLASPKDVMPASASVGGGPAKTGGPLGKK